MRKHLFIMGCDRSGTTAFVDLLNSHPQLCIGMERYKHYVATPERLTTALFEPGLFFDLRSEQTNVKWDRVYKALRLKYDSAAYVGDKVPRYFTIIGDLRRQFPGCQLIFLARDPYDVARSWKRRARDQNDVNWPESHGVERAIAVWNNSLSAYRAASKTGSDDLFLLRYESIFSRDTSCIAGLLHALGLDFHPDMKHQQQAMLNAWEQKNRPEDVLSETEHQWIHRTANQRLLDAIVAAEATRSTSVERAGTQFNSPIIGSCSVPGSPVGSVSATAERQEPNIVRVHNARLLPWRVRVRDGTKRDNVPFSGGVTDSCGESVPAARMWRYGKSIATLDESAPPIQLQKQKIKGRVFFGGYLFRQYGHFLLESLSRLWAWTPEFEGPIVFLGSSGVTPWQRHILQLLGVSTEIRIISEITDVEELLIPEPGFEIGGRFSPTHRDFLARVPCKPGKGKLWLSRSGLGETKGGVVGEREFEKRLADQGWTIFHPEQHSIDEQLAAFSNSARIAGWEGSAFHTLILLKGSDAMIDLFVRGPAEMAAPQYHDIAEAKGLRQSVHRVPLLATGGARRARRYTVVDEQQLERILMTEDCTAVSPTSTSQSGHDWASRRINTLVERLGAKTYLEIGVRHGRTFLKVQAPLRDGVDPEFTFDTSKFASDSTRFFPVTSDEFFLSGNARSQYDLMFIDGLHTFEQTFRDFVSCLTLAHDRSVLIIDDTVPNDIFSALPDQRRAMSLRAAAKVPSKAWHGDVYKLAFAIHDFFPVLDFVTIMDRGNPQTLVWRGRRHRDFRPRFGNLETISRLGYTDFLENQKILNPVKEEEGLRICLSAMAEHIE